jgi:hypothetical protein
MWGRSSPNELCLPMSITAVLYILLSLTTPFTLHPIMSSTDEPYWLGRASDEQKRLLKQHDVWTKYLPP